MGYVIGFKEPVEGTDEMRYKFLGKKGKKQVYSTLSAASSQVNALYEAQNKAYLVGDIDLKDMRFNLQIFEYQDTDPVSTFQYHF